MPQKAYMEQTVFPNSHLCRRVRGCKKEKEGSARQRQRQKINEGAGKGGQRGE